jgi:hypothetical protein
MTNTITPTETKNLDGYGGEPLAWERAQEGLKAEGLLQGPSGDGHPHTHWLVTARADGKPHIMPVGAVWDGTVFYFTSGPGTQKSTNLAHDPRCSIAVAAKGLDIVVEGEARRVTDEAKLQEIAKAFDDWGPTVKDGAFTHEFSAPSAGPPPWYVYEFTPKTVFGLATAEPYGATRWRM